MDKGRVLPLYHKESSVVFDLLQLQSAKVCFYSRQCPLCSLIAHLICGAPNRQRHEVEGPAILRFDILDFAVIDAKSTAAAKWENTSAELKQKKKLERERKWGIN